MRSRVGPVRLRAMAVLGVAVLGAAGAAAGCSTSGPSNHPTAASCAQAFRQAGGIPSDDLSSTSNQVKVQDILDACPDRAALDAAVAPYLPAGQDKAQATAQVEQSFRNICDQIGGTVKSPYCASSG